MTSLLPSLIIIVSGLFVGAAFLVVTYILMKNKLKKGPWLFISAAGFLLAIAEVFRVFLVNSYAYHFLVTVSMILLFIVALIKYWDIISLL